jgi:hypothetical protein
MSRGRNTANGLGVNLGDTLMRRAAPRGVQREHLPPLILAHTDEIVPRSRRVGTGASLDASERPSLWASRKLYAARPAERADWPNGFTNDCQETTHRCD